MTIRILSTCYNCSKYVHKPIASLQMQTVTDWVCYITDDQSTDGTDSYVQMLIEDDPRFVLIRNEKKYWQTGNYWETLQRPEIDNNDICITLDFDDWLPDENTLKRALEYYQDPNIWMTFGQFEYYYGISKPNKKGFARQPEPFDQARYLPWTSTHLRTFKAGLFRKINKQHVIDPDTGWYFTNAGDVVLFTPMLEMAGQMHVKYTNDINYIYNVETDLNEFKTSLDKTNRTNQIIRNWKPYQRLET